MINSFNIRQIQLPSESKNHISYQKKQKVSRMKDPEDHNLNICLTGKDACWLFTDFARTERWMIHLATIVVSFTAYLADKKKKKKRTCSIFLENCLNVSAALINTILKNHVSVLDLSILISWKHLCKTTCKLYFQTRKFEQNSPVLKDK